MSYTGPSYSVHLTLYIDPDQLPTFFSALKPLNEAVCAEPECIFIEIYQSPDKPGVFKVVENWNATTEWMMGVCFATARKWEKNTLTRCLGSSK